MQHIAATEFVMYVDNFLDKDTLKSLQDITVMYHYIEWQINLYMNFDYLTQNEKKFQ